ncbi:ribosome biogenesis protein Nop16 [Phlyctema vagabunda]|uniref:Nucleolar protein 16 n=1 Tax=Phlyctema vagabunda TaxID=108571 RepID=A0ABR4P2L2_9HELO
MGRELQKKKNRSSISKIKMKPKSKRVNPLGNPIIAANWNQDETLTQNYRRLGLASRLNAATGGIEKLRTGKDTHSQTSTINKLAIENAFPTTIAPAEARVERDPETGKIVRVVHDQSSAARANPLNDPLNTDSEDDEEKGYEEFDGFEGEAESKDKNEIVRKLEELAAREAPKKERTQSEREREWIERLVAVHGDDYARMFRDRKLNPMQQTENDIRRRVSKWRAKGGAIAAN